MRAATSGSAAARAARARAALSRWRRTGSTPCTVNPNRRDSSMQCGLAGPDVHGERTRRQAEPGNQVEHQAGAARAQAIVQRRRERLILGEGRPVAVELVQQCISADGAGMSSHSRSVAAPAMTIPWARAGQEPLREARQVPGPAQTRAAEDRDAAMSLATAAGSALMLTAPGPRQPRAPPEPDKLSARERELVTLAAPAPRSPPSCTSASAPSARTWTASGTRPAAAAAPTPPPPCRPTPPDPPARGHRPGPRPAHLADHQPGPAARPAGHPVLRPADEHRTASRRGHPVLQAAALAGAVPLNVDLDIALPVLASTICAALRRRLPGYASATPTHSSGDS